MSVDAMLNWYTDRSRITTDWSCPRKRYWAYHHGGRGIVRDSSPLELFLGTSTHDAMAAIATLYKANGTVDIDLVANTAFEQVNRALLEATTGELEGQTFAKEQATLIEGLVRGYYKHVWPRLIEQYPVIVAIEQEVEYGLGDNIIFMSKPDLLLEDREGEWHYIEYKTTSSKKEDWVTSWNTAVQLHSSIRAVEASLGKAPIDVTIVGLYKGWVSYGKQSSPLCYAYKRNGNPPFSEDQITYEYKAGYRRTPTWELPGGVKQWIEDMPENILSDQFPMTPPIMVNDQLVDSFFKQQLLRENEVMEATTLLREGDYNQDELVEILDRTFPQHWEECRPAWGSGCGYRQLCHGYVADPLENGFKIREPHHTPELNQWRAE